MKKFLCVAALGLFLAGCGSAAKDSEFWKHGSMYTSWDHMKYSMSGGDTCPPEVLKKAKDQHWWGIQCPDCK